MLFALQYIQQEVYVVIISKLLVDKRKLIQTRIVLCNNTLKATKSKYYSSVKYLQALAKKLDNFFGYDIILNIFHSSYFFINQYSQQIF